MKKSLGVKKAVGIFFCVSVIGLILYSPTQAASFFYDDFEDGDYSGWLLSTSGGSGSTNVQDHNDSLMAYVYHSGSLSHSLSYDFDYVAEGSLSFDIQAVAVKSGGGNNVTLHSGSGVTIDFLTIWNESLGAVSFTNVTNTSSLGTNSHYIDSDQHNFSAGLLDYAAYAGVEDLDQIDKVNLSFWAWGSQYYYSASGYTDRSSASVWFDNVTISTVPIPGGLWLLSTGLICVLGLQRKFKN